MPPESEPLNTRSKSTNSGELEVGRFRIKVSSGRLQVKLGGRDAAAEPALPACLDPPVKAVPISQVTAALCSGPLILATGAAASGQVANTTSESTAKKLDSSENRHAAWTLDPMTVVAPPERYGATTAISATKTEHLWSRYRSRFRWSRVI